MAVSRRFGRVCELTIARVTPGSFTATEPNATVIRGLRMAFEVEKNLEPTPNPASITVYNLTAQTRAELQRKPIQIRIQAGYRGNVSTLFLGDLVEAPSHREGADILTKILIADGDTCMNARVNQAFGPGTDARTQLKAIAGSMGLKVPANAADAKQLVTAVASGRALQGPARTQLTKVLDPIGGKWSIQDQQLQILFGNEVRADQALVISEATGMIGSPELGAPGKKGEPPTLTVKNLLYPECKPGGRIALDAEFLKGLYRIEKVKHSGDTDGDEWVTSLECKAV